MGRLVFAVGVGITAINAPAHRRRLPAVRSRPSSSWDPLRCRSRPIASRPGRTHSTDPRLLPPPRPLGPFRVLIRPADCPGEPRFARRRASPDAVIVGGYRPLGQSASAGPLRAASRIAPHCFMTAADRRRRSRAPAWPRSFLAVSRAKRSQRPAACAGTRWGPRPLNPLLPLILPVDFASGLCQFPRRRNGDRLKRRRDAPRPYRRFLPRNHQKHDPKRADQGRVE